MRWWKSKKKKKEEEALFEFVKSFCPVSLDMILLNEIFREVKAASFESRTRSLNFHSADLCMAL